MIEEAVEATAVAVEVIEVAVEGARNMPENACFL